jgi:hypothetical protein
MTTLGQQPSAPWEFGVEVRIRREHEHLQLDSRIEHAPETQGADPGGFALPGDAANDVVAFQDRRVDHLPEYKIATENIRSSEH